MFWTFAQVSTVTSRVSDKHIRTGIQFTSYVYLVMIGLYLAMVATMLILLFIGLAIVGLVISFFDSSADPKVRETEPKSKPKLKRLLVGPKGSTIIRGTNIFNESKAGRIGDDGKIYEGTNLINEQMVGRIDDAGNVYQGTNTFNETKAGRIADGGKIYQGANVFTEEHIGRMDSKGNVYEGTNFLNEEGIGRVQEKK